MDRRTTRSLLLIAGCGCLAAALSDWPYAFFTLLRLLVTAAAVLTLAATPSDPRFTAHRLPLLILALLFNPFVPVRFNRDVWGPIDLATGLYLLAVGAIVWREPKPREATAAPAPGPEVVSSAHVQDAIKDAIADWKRGAPRRPR